MSSSVATRRKKFLLACSCIKIELEPSRIPKRHPHDGTQREREKKLQIKCCRFSCKDLSCKDLGQIDSSSVPQNLFLQICGGAKPSADGGFVFSDGIPMMVTTAYNLLSSLEYLEFEGVYCMGAQNIWLLVVS
ncbi:hypothetical protein B0H14DRAFT_2554779 [Mycena olivaceomarginata]|nr:hypothetical protein B0H14DRAFT_2554779 [Mycena olivaceomarginata]